LKILDFFRREKKKEEVVLSEGDYRQITRWGCYMYSGPPFATDERNPNNLVGYVDRDLRGRRVPILGVSEEHVCFLHPDRGIVWTSKVAFKSM
jgi:hypothetical protein